MEFLATGFSMALFLIAFFGVVWLLYRTSEAIYKTSTFGGYVFMFLVVVGILSFMSYLKSLDKYHPKCPLEITRQSEVSQW